MRYTEKGENKITELTNKLETQAEQILSLESSLSSIMGPELMKLKEILYGKPKEA